MGHRSSSRLQKKQADIIVICSLISFLLNTLVQIILPALQIIKLPYIGQLLSLIMLLGVDYAIIKYQFMSIPTSLITNELFNELSGLTFLVNAQGFIMKSNKQVDPLLGYTEEEVIGCHISSIMKHKDIDKVLDECELINERLRFQDSEVRYFYSF
ncbi:MAG: PAS domain-containing protein [Herbinix sp.]|nr:PAS domain-containing protein [Herbinix sp.]